MSLKKIAMIPARIGSTRLKMKNLALINGMPMISYVIKAAVESGAFDEVIVNSDNNVFKAIANKYGAKFYLRPGSLGSSVTKSDDVVLDFMQKYPSDIVAWVNPTSPLQTAGEVRGVMEHFVSDGLDSLITTRAEQVHCNFDLKPLNYDPDGLFAQTQDLVPVERFVYSMMVWRANTFKEKMKKDGSALFCGKFGTFNVSKETALIVKKEEDLRLLDLIEQGRQQVSGAIKYDPLIKTILGE